MIEAFYGANGMPTGILIDQLGTYLVLSTVGIVLICLYSEGAVTRSEIAKRIVTFPPLIALVIAVALMPVTYPPLVSSVLIALPTEEMVSSKPQKVPSRPRKTSKPTR